MSRSRAKGARRYPVPATYPVDASLIPDMPVELFHLHTAGHVLATERAQYGWPPMTCAACGEPVYLIYRHEPIAPSEVKGRMTPRTGKALPSSGWGTDVAVICRCCSFATCPHCLFHGELILGHTFNEHGRCTRCGHASQVTNHQLTHRLAQLATKAAGP